MDDVDQGLKSDIDNALQQLDDLKNNSWYESDVDATVQRDVDLIEHHIKTLQPYVNSFMQVMDKVYKPRSLNEISELKKLQTNANQNGSNVEQSLEAMTKTIEDVLPILDTGITNFSSQWYQQQHTSPTWLSKGTGWLGEALHGRWGLIANDFQSAVNALNTLRSSLKETYQKIQNLDEIQNQYVDKLESSVASLQSSSRSSKLNFPEAIPSSDKAMWMEKTYHNEEPGFNNEGYSQLVGILGRRPTERETEFFRDIFQGDGV